MTHTADHCPAYEKEKALPGFISWGDKMATTAAEMRVKVLNILWASPDHTAYALLEADSISNIARFVNSMPIKQEFRVTPVANLVDVVALAKEIVAKR
jgi:hypothetical protein